MKCNICGAELESGERICRYCGNEPVAQDFAEKADANDVSEQTNPVASVEHTDVDAERRVFVPQSEKRSKYCTKCGRPLDGMTNKCVVCEASEVGSIGYRKNITKEIPEEYNMAGSRNRKRKKKQNKTVIFFVLLVVMIVLFAASFLIFFNLLGGTWGSEEPTPTPTPQATETLIVNTQPVRTPEVIEDTGKQPTQTPSLTEPPKDEPEEIINYHGGEYLFPSYEKVISEKELESMSRQEIKLVLQEIYARYGYTFDDDDLIEHFESQSWYIPTTSDIDEIEAQFNKYEKENVETIENYQRKMGWRI